jgi:hypothetical protein
MEVRAGRLTALIVAPVAVSARCGRTARARRHLSAALAIQQATHAVRRNGVVAQQSAAYSASIAKHPDTKETP